jgi:Lon protease-like protein
MNSYKLDSDILMKKITVTLPIFPLPVFLLPGGVTKLRIFEPRYLKMVSTASSGQGFVVWLQDKKISANESSTSMPWGSWVEIINFDQGDDGILEIDVKCKSLVVIKSIVHDANNLHFGDVSRIAHWSEIHANMANGHLARSLASVFAENESLNRLYPKKGLNDDHWVLARWLEILPIELNVKNAFVVCYSFNDAKAFVESVILE